MCSFHVRLHECDYVCAWCMFMSYLASGGMWICVCPSGLTLRGFCVMSSRLVDSRLSFMATYRRLPSSSGIRECRSPATRGNVSRRPFWISSDGEQNKKTKLNQWRLPVSLSSFEAVLKQMASDLSGLLQLPALHNNLVKKKNTVTDVDKAYFIIF